MMRLFKIQRIWLVLGTIQLALALTQNASAQTNSFSNAGLTPYKRSATPSTDSSETSGSSRYNPLTFFKNARTKMFGKQESQRPVKQSNAKSNEPLPAQQHPIQQSAFRSEAHRSSTTREATSQNQNNGLRSQRYTAIPMRPSQNFSDLQRSSPSPVTSFNHLNSSRPASSIDRQSRRDTQTRSRETPEYQFTNSWQTATTTPQYDRSRLHQVSAEAGEDSNSSVSPIPNRLTVPPAPRQTFDRRESTGSPDEVDERLMTLELNQAPIADRLQYSNQNGKMTLVVRDVPIGDVIGFIAQQNGLNIVANSDVIGSVTVALTDVSLDEALSSILLANGYVWIRSNNVLLISRLSRESASSPLAQGRQLQVFPLNYVSAVEIDKVVAGLLSPVGQSFITETAPTQKLKTREQIVVEDLPEYVARIGQYIQQVDFPPQQVYIEAHVLQVTLKDENRHGVNFNQLLRLGNSRLTLETVGFANPLASPAFFLGIDGTDLNALVELLQTTTDSKTLASPKVMVLNGQEARIQIGEQLGYLVTTTTQTSTLQEVNFLDLGVVLRVTPQITDNNQVLMTVKPEVSSGRINPLTGLPEEDTTEVETTIMLSDGQGMIIGGLIKEEDTDIQSKIPIIGDLWAVGRLFQRRTTTKERTEIIIALIPKVMPCPSACLPGHEEQLAQVTTPLFGDQLRPNFRPWEPTLPDAYEDPRCLKVDRLPEIYRNLHDDYPHRIQFYFPSVAESCEPLFGGNYQVHPAMLPEEYEEIEHQHSEQVIFPTNLERAEPLFGDSAKAQPLLIPEPYGPFYELQCKPEYYDAE